MSETATPRLPQLVSAWLRRQPIPFLTILNRAGYAVAIGIVLLIYVAQVIALLKYPYFSPPSNVEEGAYTYLSASNYNRFGFSATDFLQDFATSTNPADHPYVYDHMPPGPDITMALLLRATHDNFALTNILLASLVPIGFLFYLVFLRRILAQHDLYGAGIVAFLTGWLQFPGLVSRPISTPFLLLTFGPLVAIAQRNGKPGWLLPCCLPIVLLSSVYLDYAALAGVLACWVLLYWTQLLPLSRRTAVLVLGTIATGIGLNLLKNFVYFGPSLFFDELGKVLGNRIIGFPTQQMLHDFYAEHGIVHHGAPLLHPLVVLQVLGANVTFAGGGALLLAALLAVATTLEIRSQNTDRLTIALGSAGMTDLKYLASLGLWAVGSTVAPVILFPAFAQEVSQLGLTNQIWMTVFAAGLSLTALKRVALGFRGLPFSSSLHVDSHSMALSLSATDGQQSDLRNLRQWATSNPGTVAVIVLGMLSFWSLLNGLNFAARTRHGELVAVANIYRKSPARELEALRKFSGGYFMTNINTPTIYFYTRQPGFGVCGLDSIDAEGRVELAKCKIAFMRNAKRYAATPPAYFFFFKEARYFPGFADCLPSNAMVGQQELAGSTDCLAEQDKRLSTSYERVFNSDTFSVFDLHRPMNSANVPRSRE